MHAKDHYTMHAPRPPASPPPGTGQPVSLVPQEPSGPPPPIVPPGLRRGPRPPSEAYNPKSLPPPIPDQYKKGPRPPSAAYQQLDDGFDDPDLDRKTGGINKIHEKRLWQRMVLAGLAVSLLWATSLAVVRAIVRDYFIPSPTMDTVGEELVAYGVTMDNERDGYAVCAQGQLENCEEQFLDEQAIELQRVADNAALNDAALASNRLLREQAKSHVNESMNILADLVDNNGLNISNPLFLNTSGNSCPIIEEFIAGRTQAAKAINLYAEFTDNQTEYVTSLSEALARRAAYDEEYILNKTEEIREFGDLLAERAANRTREIYDTLGSKFDGFRSCLSFDPANECPGISVMDQFDLNLNLINGTYDSMLGTYDVVFGDVENWVDNFEDLLDKVNNANDKLDQLGFPFEIDTGGINCPCADPDIPFTGVFPPTAFDAPTTIGGNLDSILDGMADALGGTINLSEFKLDLLAGNLSDFYDTGWQGLEDYDPPPITQDPLADFTSTTDQQSEDFENELEGYVGTDDGTGDDFVEPVPTQIDFPENKEEFLALFPNNTRLFDFYVYEASVFNTLSSNLAFVVDLAVYADIIWRVTHTVYLINKYWNLSNLGKPPGDVRINSISGKNWGLKATPDQKVARLLTHPFTIASVSLFFTILIVFTMWSIYEPFFTAYSDGCVNNDAQAVEAGAADGTMIYRNLFTIGFQYATGEGDSIVTTEVDRINLIAEIDCESFFANSSEANLAQAEIQEAIREDYLESLTLNEELKTCLNLEAIDIDQGSNLETRAGSTLYDGLTELLDATYDCSAVGGSCSIGCPDPASVSLQNNAHRSGCTFEWWMHASVVGTSLIIVVFILMNVSRIEFVKAVVRIWWRNISPGDFTYLATCTRSGEHVDPEQVTEEGLSMRETIQQELKIALTRWERWGYIHAVYAVSLNIPWLWACVFMSKNITFDG